jgi:hypothetical protein
MGWWMALVGLFMGVLDHQESYHGQNKMNYPRIETAILLRDVLCLACPDGLLSLRNNVENANCNPWILLLREASTSGLVVAGHAA